MSTTARKSVPSKTRNNLTEEQKNEIKEAFDLFDADGYVNSIAVATSAHSYNAATSLKGG